MIVMLCFGFLLLLFFLNLVTGYYFESLIKLLAFDDVDNLDGF